MGPSFLSCLSQEAVSLYLTQRYGQSLRVESAHNSFSSFLHARSLDVAMPVSALTTRIVCDYQQWLSGNSVMKNSISCYTRMLQSVYNKVVSGLDAPAENPFSLAYRGIAKTRKRAACISVIQRLVSLDIRQGLVALGKSPGRKSFFGMLDRTTFARDLFIFCYCACGMAFVDAAYLRKEDLRNGIIRYRRRKTGQLMEVSVEPLMQDILDRYASQAADTPYLLPILPVADSASTYRAYRTALRTYNSRLKQLSEMLGGGVSLSSYVARHSWASNMHELDMPLSVISQGLGHESELTTQIYIKSLETSKVHEANRAFINRVFSYPLLSHERDFFGCKGT